jgi:hypothetical protein
MVMGDCLRALKTFILNEQKELEVAMNTKATTIDDIEQKLQKMRRNNKWLNYILHK